MINVGTGNHVVTANISYNPDEEKKSPILDTNSAMILATNSEIQGQFRASEPIKLEVEWGETTEYGNISSDTSHTYSAWYLYGSPAFLAYASFDPLVSYHYRFKATDQAGNITYSLIIFGVRAMLAIT